MRKNIILITFLIFTTFLCLAQSDSTSQKKVLGVRAGFTFSYINEEPIYYANVSLEKGKNFVSVGPIFGEGMPIEFNYPNDYNYKKVSLKGLNFVYQINPNPKGKRFDFYFQYLFNYLHYSDKGITESIYVINTRSYATNISYESYHAGFGSTLGYGFKYNFFNSLYLFQDFGLGVGYESLSIDYNDVRFNRNYQNFRPIIGLNIGLEYKFDKKIRK